MLLTMTIVAKMRDPTEAIRSGQVRCAAMRRKGSVAVKLKVAPLTNDRDYSRLLGFSVVALKAAGARFACVADEQT